MTSQRKIESNRANACASTGPKTAKGKARAAQNARRHGLNVSVRDDLVTSEKVNSLARKIAGQNASVEIQELAQCIAESQVDLYRVRRARHYLLKDYLDRPYYEIFLDPPVIKARTIIAALRAYDRGAEIPDALIAMINGQPKLQKIVSRLSGFTTRLVRLDRYERRALSRRKFAIRAFYQYRR